MKKHVEGIFLDVAEADYHAADWAVSSTVLKTLWTHDAQTAKWRMDHRVDTPAFAVGRAIHARILGVGTPIEEKLDGRTSAGKEQAARAAVGEVTVLSAADMRVVEGCETAVRAWRETSEVDMLDSALCEASIVWKDPLTGVWCKCRPDAMIASKTLVIDVKTCRDAHPEAFAEDAARHAYPVQAAFYARGVQSFAGVWPRFAFLAVSKSEPHQVGLYEVPAAVMDVADRLVGKLLSDWDFYQTVEGWPGLPLSMQPLTLPRWATRKLFEDAA